MLSSGSDYFGSVPSRPHFDSDHDADPVILPPRHSAAPAPSLVVSPPPAYEPPTVPQPVHGVLPVKELPPVPSAIVPPPCTPVSSPDCSLLSGAPPESAAVVPLRRSGRGLHPILAQSGL